VALRIGRLPDSSLTATRIGAIRDVVVASPAYLARAGRPARPEDLAAHTCITFEGLHAPRQWVFRSAGAEHLVPIRSRLTVNTAEAATDAAAAGLGLTRVLCYQVETAVAAGRLVTVLHQFEPAPHPVSLVHAGGRLLPLKLRAFLDFAVPRLRARTPQE
jgi:DNA-binding transcriptional LysR family regulator